MSGWGCPHEQEGACQRVPGKACDPGMKGCTLFGRFTFSSADKNISRRLQKNETAAEKESKD
ncbi:hypothetical protein FE236_01750 [Mariprofundus erugo]|uniref:Uncharacterized protein n=1 Tax=Mariprofundus erugo TaxID=2528639 RepID=A0A5R9GIG1_9PROT|nr:hypothetical protein FEF65_10115 [Mariprofundus erugo]TLS77859.1 hypothetical protein FE236_01750 [Mariprofundus erugo]